MELLKKGINTNCRLFDVKEDECVIKFKISFLANEICLRLEQSGSVSTFNVSPNNDEDYQVFSD